MLGRDIGKAVSALGGAAAGLSAVGKITKEASDFAGGGSNPYLDSLADAETAEVAADATESIRRMQADWRGATGPAAGIPSLETGVSDDPNEALFRLRGVDETSPTARKHRELLEYEYYLRRKQDDVRRDRVELIRESQSILQLKDLADRRFRQSREWDLAYYIKILLGLAATGLVLLGGYWAWNKISSDIQLRQKNNDQRERSSEARQDM